MQQMNLIEHGVKHLHRHFNSIISIEGNDAADEFDQTWGEALAQAFQ